MAFLEEFALRPGSGRTGLSVHPEELKQGETKGDAHFHLPILTLSTGLDRFPSSSGKEFTSMFSSSLAGVNCFEHSVREMEIK